MSIVQEAGSRAQACLERQHPETACALALDEQYSSKRGEGYLNVVDAHSSVVWASMPPVAVDGESWTILLWYLQEQGIKWENTVSDGGRAIQEALTTLKANATHQRDVWHLLHLASQVQGRVDRSLDKMQAQLATVVRQAQRIATGQKARGAHPGHRCPGTDRADGPDAPRRGGVALSVRRVAPPLRAWWCWLTSKPWGL